MTNKNLFLIRIKSKNPSNHIEVLTCLKHCMSSIQLQPCNVSTALPTRFFFFYLNYLKLFIYLSSLFHSNDFKADLKYDFVLNMEGQICKTLRFSLNFEICLLYHLLLPNQFVVFIFHEE